MPEPTISDDETYGRAMDRAIRWLAARSRSRQEVCDRLRRLGFSEQVVDGVEARLVELSILDDQEFARGWVERGLDRGRARRLLDRELDARRVDREAIDAAMEEFRGGGTELERAAELAHKRAPALATLAPEQAWRRLANHLARKGYEEEVVEEVCRRILGDRLGPQV